MSCGLAVLQSCGLEVLHDLHDLHLDIPCKIIKNN